MIQYTPKKYVDMPNLAEQPFVSAWKGHERILHDLIERFNIPCRTALEFGVQWGYSTSALANVFEKVIGVDTFQGDKHAGVHGLCFSDTSRRLRPWSNIQLIQQTYQDRILLDSEQYDLIHIDIVHTYEDTFALGLWAAAHARIVIFHDTESYPEVKRAVADIAKQTGREFYNYEPHYGLGILAPPRSEVTRDTRVLIGYITAHHASRIPHVQSQRARMANSPLDYKFIYGAAESQAVKVEPRSPLSDELFFPVDDTKPFMVLKDKALFQWALDHGYEYVFRACDDSVVYPERIIWHFDYLKQHDYAGTMCGYGKIAGTKPGEGIFVLRYLDYMHGGVGIWLSRKAMEMLIADDWKGPYSSPYSNQIELTPGSFFKGSWGHAYWDDHWIGEVLKGNLNYNDPRRNNIYYNYLVNVYDNPELFASNNPFDPNKVIATHSLEQMGTSDVKPGPFSTLYSSMAALPIDWQKTDSKFHAVAP
jgi:hypothetical protein